jgi:hypothetical protein
MRNFLDGVRTRKPPFCAVRDAFQSAATVQLGMIAYNTGARIRWDRQKLDIAGNPEARKLLQHP